MRSVVLQPAETRARVVFNIQVSGYLSGGPYRYVARSKSMKKIKLQAMQKFTR